MGDHNMDVPHPSQLLLSRAPRCGSGPNCPLEAHPLRQLEDPSFQPQPFPPYPPPSPDRPGSFGNAPGRAAWAGVVETAHRGGGGRPSKRHLGPDPHLWALDPVRKQLNQAPPGYGPGRYGSGFCGVQDSILRDRCSVGTRHALFSIIFVSKQCLGLELCHEVRNPGPQ